MGEIHLWQWRFTDEFGKRRVTSWLMARDHIHCEILTRATEVVGGEDKLAQHLDVRFDVRL